MAENIFTAQKADKEEKYQSLLSQIEALTQGETDTIANLANIASALYFGMGFFWVGFYRVADEDELVLGPFHGPVACTRIRYGKGVCGTAWEKKQSIVVPNVDEFPGHIACSSDSKSEIVLCISKNNQVQWILDIDSNRLNDFDETDKKYLEKLCSGVIEPLIV